MLVSHYTAKIVRVLNGAFNLTGFIVMLTCSLNHPSWFTGTSGVIISFCVAVDSCYVVILALEAFKYPEKLTVFVEDIVENGSLLLEDSTNAIGNNS